MSRDVLMLTGHKLPFMVTSYFCVGVLLNICMDIFLHTRLKVGFGKGFYAFSQISAP